MSLQTTKEELSKYFQENKLFWSGEFQRYFELDKYEADILAEAICTKFTNLKSMPLLEPELFSPLYREKIKEDDITLETKIIFQANQPFKILNITGHVYKFKNHIPIPESIDFNSENNKSCNCKEIGIQTTAANKCLEESVKDKDDIIFNGERYVHNSKLLSLKSNLMPLDERKKQ